MIGKFTKDSLITFSARFLNVILGIVISVIVARTLGPEKKGIYSLVILFQVILINFADFGIGSSAVFYIGKKKYSLKEIFGANILFSILISILTILIGLVIIFFFSGKIFPYVPREYLFSVLFLIPSWFFLKYIICIFSGIQNFKKYNLINLIEPILFLALMVIFLWQHCITVSTIIMALIISWFIPCVILFFQIKKEIGRPVFSVNKNIFKDLFVYGIKNYLSNIFSVWQSRIDTFLINIFLNPMAIGFYSIATGISEQLWLIPDSISTVLFPRVSSETNEKKIKEFTPIVCRNTLFIMSLLAAFLFLIGHWLITFLYSEQFINSVIPFQILLIGMVMLSGRIILAHDFFGRGKPMLNTYITASALVINTILNIILIPKFGIIGAATATSISYAISFIITSMVYIKISGNSIKDLVIFKKDDIKLYQNLIILIKNKYFNFSK